MEREKRFPVTTAWIETWVKMRSLEKPLSLKRIADWYGVSASIVHRYTKDKVGHVRAQGGHHRKFNWDEARRLERETNMTRAEIARYLGVTPPAVTRVLGPKREQQQEAA
jgi:predicted transcriptional regulator